LRYKLNFLRGNAQFLFHPNEKSDAIMAKNP